MFHPVPDIAYQNLLNVLPCPRLLVSHIFFAGQMGLFWSAAASSQLYTILVQKKPRSRGFLFLILGQPVLRLVPVSDPCQGSPFQRAWNTGFSLCSFEA